MEKYTDLIISANCTVIYKICIKINYFNYNYRRIVITKSLNIEKIDGWYNLKRQLIPEVDIVSRQYAFPRKSFATMTLRNICVQMTLDMICPIRRNHNPGLSSSTTYHRVCNKSNTTGATCGAETANISGAPEFTPVFRWVRVARSLIFRVTFCFIVCLFSTIFQLYRGGQFYWWRQPEDPGNPIDLSKVPDKRYQKMFYTSP